MKYSKKNKLVTAWGITAAIVIGMILPPMGSVVKVSAAGDSYAGGNTTGPRVSATATATATGKPTAVTTGGGIVTPRPTKTPRPTRTPRPTMTPKPTSSPQPLVTAKPKADTYLGDQDEKIILTVGVSGEFDIDRKVYDSYILDKLVKIQYSADDSSILQVTEEGQYKAVKAGQTNMDVWGYDTDGQKIFDYTYTIAVYPDMSKVTLAKNKVTIYQVKGNYGDSSEVKIAIKGGASSIFDENKNEDLVYSVTSSNKKMYVESGITKGNLVLSCTTAGKTTLTVNLYGKEYKVHLTVAVVSINASSVLLVKNKTKAMKIKGYKGKITWKSSRPAVASVTSKGKVRSKKEGNTIISAKFGDIKLGCVISVTTAKKKKVIRRAQHMARTSQYSQPKRMQKGYYDCSSLVWRAYSKYGYRFGAASYAPTAAAEAQYMAVRHKMLKGGFSRKNAQKLKFKAGDLMFETGASNGRYKGIYHVEMIIGYEFYGWENNKPVVVVKWANRTDGYYGYGVGIVGKM